MQPMSYYQQQGYQTSAQYAVSGAPSGASVLSQSVPPPMMNPGNGLPPMPHHGLDNTAQAGGLIQAPKRKQVKNACTNCQKACKKCDDARPCPRCIKYGIADTCVNSVRKERKKGVKRGPYKRRQKPDADRATRKGGDILEGVHPQQQQTQAQNSQYMRTSAMPGFGYPSNLNQYGQQPYNPYGSYANYSKDQILPQSYVMNPLYPSMNYPVLVAGQNENGNNQQSHSYQHSPVSQQHYNMLQQHTTQGSRSFDQQVLQQQGANSQSMYYVAQQQAQQQAQAQQHQQQPALRSPHADIKDEGLAKPQTLTPVPSASTSSGASSPPEPAGDDDGSKFARLSQLCSAALDHNNGTEPSAADGNQQQS